jgi:hypothetical protein
MVTQKSSYWYVVDMSWQKNHQIEHQTKNLELRFYSENTQS